MAEKTADPRFAALRQEVAQDLKPVAPLRLGRIALASIGAFAIAALAVFMVSFGWREDALKLGHAGFWLPSLIMIGLATPIFAFGLREATPGQGSRWLLGTMTTLTLACHLGTTFWTWKQGPLITPAEDAWRLWAFCLLMVLAIGISLLAVCFHMVRRGLITDFRLFGWWMGLGSALLVEALWRLICPFGDLHHVLTAHTPGLFLIFLGALGAAAWLQRIRLKAWRTRNQNSSPS